jgi:hypothetical protein
MYYGFARLATIAEKVAVCGGFRITDTLTAAASIKPTKRDVAASRYEVTDTSTILNAVVSLQFWDNVRGKDALPNFLIGVSQLVTDLLAAQSCSRWLLSD